jgi:hypothetical protein
VDPAYAVDHAALDPVDVIPLRPLQALLKVPIAAVESVSVEPNFDHGSRTPFKDAVLARK